LWKLPPLDKRILKMPSRTRKRRTEADAIQQIEHAGNAVITKGKQFCLAVARGKEPSRETVSVVFLRRQLKTHGSDPDRGLRKSQLKTIRIFEALGLKVVSL
jgi:hypothetical protein